MGGRSYRVPDVVSKAWWNVRVNGVGEIEITDGDGVDVMRHPMPLARLRNRQLAGWAPMGRYALGVATKELARQDPGWQTRDGQMVAWLWEVMLQSKPLVADEMRMLPLENQSQLYLEAAA